MKRSELKKLIKECAKEILHDRSKTSVTESHIELELVRKELGDLHNCIVTIEKKLVSHGSASVGVTQELENIYRSYNKLKMAIQSQYSAKK